MPAEKVTTKSENRRSNKPLMEKRRRARINHSLSELKNLILDAMKKDTSRNSKLEKADILEMAVRHLQDLQRQQATMAASPSVSGDSTDDDVMNNANVQNKYRAGYNECAKEVSRFLETVDGIDSTVRGRLIGHLLNCLNEICLAAAAATNSNNNNGVNSDKDAINNLNGALSPSTTTTTNSSSVVAVANEGSAMDCEPSSSDDRSSSPGSAFDDVRSVALSGGSDNVPLAVRPIHIHIPAASIPLSLLSSHHSVTSPTDKCDDPSDVTKSASPVATSSATTTPALFHGLQLIPTRLATGELAFLVPTSSQQQQLTGSATCSLSASSSSSNMVASNVARGTCLILSTSSGDASASSSSHAAATAAPSATLPSMAHAMRQAVAHVASAHFRRTNHNNNATPMVIKGDPVWRPW